MHVIVVGAGLTGLQSALHLLKDSVEVTLIEAARAPCQGASYCAAASINDPEPMPLAPAAGLLARLRAMTGNTTNLVFGSGTAMRHAGFIAAMTAARNPERFEKRREVFATLARESMQLLHADAEREGFVLQESAGTFLVHDTPVTGDGVLTPEAAFEREPALLEASSVAAVTPSEATTWSVSFYAKQLREHLVSRGVRILCNRRVTGLLSDGSRTVGVEAGETIRANAVLIAAGTGAVDLLPDAAYGGVALAPLTRAVFNIELSVDQGRVRRAIKTADGRTIVPLDAFLRLLGRWHLGTPEQCDLDAEYKALWSLGVRLLPHAASWSGGRYLKGTVLSSPDGLPLVGASAYPGLYLNIAGGLHTSDFAPSYARAAADAILGRENALLEELAWTRFSR